MMKYEFEHCVKELNSVGCKISDTDYKLIEKVYTFHPCVSETNGKAQVAWLYNEFGMRIFKDMEATADANMKLEEAIREARRTLQRLLDTADELRKGTVD